MADSTGVSVVLCTAPVADAERLADRLLAEGLVACVNLVGPVRSRYRWQGAIETAEEILLVLKTAEDRFGTLRQRITELHPYDVPEIVAVPVSHGLQAYLQWVRSECGNGPVE